VVKDIVGRDIVVGEDIAYPVRRGSNLWMSRMNVTSIETLGNNKFKIVGLNPEGRRTSVTSIGNVVSLGKVRPVDAVAVA
jgi:hypothetical protein